PPRCRAGSSARGAVSSGAPPRSCGVRCLTPRRRFQRATLRPCLLWMGRRPPGGGKELLMRVRSGSIVLACLVTLAALGVASNDAHACGGCFHPEDQARTTVVTAHRMALSISQDQTVLWDQVQYAGEPQDFAWVLPVKAGAYIEVGTDAWFETLDAATSTRVLQRAQSCGFGGGDVG